MTCQSIGALVTLLLLQGCVTMDPGLRQTHLWERLNDNQKMLLATTACFEYQTKLKLSMSPEKPGTVFGWLGDWCEKWDRL